MPPLWQATKRWALPMCCSGCCTPKVQIWTQYFPLVKEYPLNPRKSSFLRFKEHNEDTLGGGPIFEHQNAVIMPLTKQHSWLVIQGMEKYSVLRVGGCSRSHCMYYGQLPSSLRQSLHCRHRALVCLQSPWTSQLVDCYGILRKACSFEWRGIKRQNHGQNGNYKGRDS